MRLTSVRSSSRTLSLIIQQVLLLLSGVAANFHAMVLSVTSLSVSSDKDLKNLLLLRRCRQLFEQSHAIHLFFRNRGALLLDFLRRARWRVLQFNGLPLCIAGNAGVSFGYFRRHVPDHFHCDGQGHIPFSHCRNESSPHGVQT